MAEWSLDEVSYERYRQVKEKLTESEAIWLHGGFGGVFLRAILSLGGCMVEWFHFPAI